MARTLMAEAASGDLQQFRQQLEALAAAQVAALGGVSEELLAALVRQLKETGAMLSMVAVPHFCNNPSCGNISGPTDAQLVSGRSCICAGCRMARYCGQDCQLLAWPQHQQVCKAIGAAVLAG
jgi:hypothetical protein